MPIPKLHRDKVLHKVSLRCSTENNIHMYFYQDRYYCKNAHILKIELLLFLFPLKLEGTT